MDYTVKKLSRSKESYIKNNGWSSHNFFSVAMKIFPFLEERGYELDFGRHVIYISRCGVLVKKFYVHYNNRSREFVTITDRNGAELASHHFEDPEEDILATVDKWFPGTEIF